MTFQTSHFPKLHFLLIASAILASCSPEAKKARMLERAEEYFKAAEYDKARIEYLNVLRADPANSTAIQQLGLIWSEQGAPVQAVQYLLKTREIAPANTAARAKLAQTAMALGDAAEARKEAMEVLRQAPTHVEAALMLADTARTEEEVQQTQQFLRDLSQGESPAFHLASASFFIRKGDIRSAELEVTKALTTDPKLAAAHSVMSNVSLMRKNLVQAERELKAAAELSPLRSTMRLRYAEFLAQTGRKDEAVAVLSELAKQAADYLPAWITLARMQVADNKLEDALASLENVFGRDGSNVDGRLLQGQIWIAKREPKKAVEALERHSKLYPKLPAIKYHLARAYLQSSLPAQAMTALSEAVALNSDYAEAILLLGELRLLKGDATPVVSDMTVLLKKHPGLAQAALLLAAAYQALGRLDDAAATVRTQIQATPDSAQMHLILGLVLRRKNQIDDARKSLNRALELAPNDLRVVSQVVDLDLQEKNYASAMQRVREHLARTPKAAPIQFMEARIYAAQSDWDLAEAALLKTLELDPEFSGAYDLLVSTYVAANKLDPALEKLQGVLDKNPDSTGALMMSGLIHQQKKDFVKARDAYEKLVAANPESAAGLNNLAYMYVEGLNQTDKAYELARKARAIDPNNPFIADTLGWILYKRGDYAGAAVLLQESAGKLGDQPENQYHFGMACYMMGQTEAARAAFEKSAAASLEADAKEEMQHRLALLTKISADSLPLSVADLDATVARYPDDVVASVRLGELHEKAGANDKAAAAYERALKVNPKLLTATVKLAQVYGGALNDQSKAVMWAKQARELAPLDPKVAGAIGGIAFRAGNLPWAYSLLQESVRALPSNAEILHDYAWAAYSQGRVKDAREAMESSIKAEPNGTRSEDVQRFLKLTDPGLTKEKLVACAPDVDKLLQADPEYVPALMAKADSQVQVGETKGAETSYNLVLKRYPDFTPAQKKLAALWVDNAETRQKAYDLAVNARRARPEDPDLARTFAQINYHRREFAYAIQLFREAAAKEPLTAKDLYYLGMSLKETKSVAQSREALQGALASGLDTSMAKEAERALSELPKE